MKLLKNVENAALKGWIVRDNGDVIPAVAIGQEVTGAFWVVVNDSLELLAPGYFKDKFEDAQGLALYVLRHPTP